MTEAPMTETSATRIQAPIDDIVGMEQYNTLGRRIAVIYLPLAVFLFVLLFPFYWMAITAIKPDHQLTNYSEYSPFWVVGPTLEHIKYLVLRGDQRAVLEDAHLAGMALHVEDALSRRVGDAVEIAADRDHASRLTRRSMVSTAL